MPSTRARKVVAVGLAVKPVGKPDAGNPHVRFDERGRETGQLLPRPSSTLQVSGRKRHIITDTLGFLVGLLIHTADIQDRDGAAPLLASIRRCYPWLRHVFADGGYAGQKLIGALRGMGGWTIQIVKRSDSAKGFVVLPRRWVVERTFAWLGRNRRLAKDFEKSIASAETWTLIASVRLMTQRLANA